MLWMSGKNCLILIGEHNNKETKSPGAIAGAKVIVIVSCLEIHQVVNIISDTLRLARTASFF